MRPEKSGNLEVFFVAGDGRQILKRPFFFHHIPKTSGTAFRHAVRDWLWRHDAGVVTVPHFAGQGAAAAAWAGEVPAFYRAAQSLGRIEAVMSHYTAGLAAVIDDPIVAMVRAPDAQLGSALAFSPKRLASHGRRLLEHRAINNAQMRSLTGEDVPIYAPDSPADRQPWLDLVDRTIARFTLFRTEDRDVLIRHCAEVYGMAIEDQPRLKVRASDETTDRSVDKILKIARRRDPVWLDRILYECLSSPSPHAINSPDIGQS